MKIWRDLSVGLLAAVLVFSCLSHRSMAKPSKRVIQIYLASYDERDNTEKNPFGLIPVSRTIAGKAPAREALEALLAGPMNDSNERRLGSPHTMNLRVQSLFIVNGTARVSLRSINPRLLRWPGDSAPGRFREAIERTLKQFPAIRRVIICLDGFSDFDDMGEHARRRCH